MTSNSSGSVLVLGRLHSVGGVGVIRLEERFDTGIDEAWSALTDRDRLARWYGEVEGELRVVGEFVYRDMAAGIGPGYSGLVVSASCTDLAGNSATDSVTVNVDTMAPVVSYAGDTGTYSVDQSVAITCSSSDALSGVASDTCADVSGPAWSFGLGSHTVSATATDSAGNTGSNSASFSVAVDSTSLCGLVQELSTNSGIAHSLCVKLDAAAAAAARGQSKTKTNVLGAFDNEVRAQSGKAFTAAQAALLTAFAATL